MKKIKVALIGNPNSGKSTLFNALTGLSQKVANFPGVTVEKKTGTCRLKTPEGEPVTAECIDLPGTYSLYPKTIDEQIPFRSLCDPSGKVPDAVVVVAEGTNLKRSLFLCSQVIDLKIPVVLVVNMMDIVNYRGIRIDLLKLSEKLGVKVIPAIARKGIGVKELKEALAGTLPVPETEFIDTAGFAPLVVGTLREKLGLKSNYAAFQLANNVEFITRFAPGEMGKQDVRDLLKQHQFDGTQQQARETLERYKVITLLMKECVKTETKQQRPFWSRRLDDILTHRFWGYIVFLSVLFLIFQAIFSWAAYPMEFIDWTFASAGGYLQEALPEGVLNDLIVNGILAGLAGIIIFIPQIAILFAFIALLEDTGYMARVSFIMDRVMRRYGLSGRSVIPLIGGVACAVPSILSTRTIQSFKQRIITIMVIPLMSCSARLPVYTLIISMIIPTDPVWGVINRQGLVLMAMYLIGFFAAIGAAAFMKWFVRARDRDFFVMELPLYRVPRWRNLGMTIIEKVKIFLFDAGKIIIAISIILWFLSSRGPGERYESLKVQAEQLKATDESAPGLRELQSLQLEASYAGKMGKWMEPVIAPLGFDWKIGIALVTSFAAREVFVGTMSTIYSAGSHAGTERTVREKMMAEVNPVTGGPRYTVAVGWSLMLFYAFALQCMSTIAVVRRETGGWKWPAIQFVYLSALAYLASLLAYQGLS